MSERLLWERKEYWNVCRRGWEENERDEYEYKNAKSPIQCRTLRRSAAEKPAAEKVWESGEWDECEGQMEESESEIY